MRIKLTGPLTAEIEFGSPGELVGLLEGLTCEHECADRHGLHNGTTHCLIQGLKEIAARF